MKITGNVINNGHKLYP